MKEQAFEKYKQEVEQRKEEKRERMRQMRDERAEKRFGLSGGKSLIVSPKEESQVKDELDEIEKNQQKVRRIFKTVKIDRSRSTAD